MSQRSLDLVLWGATGYTGRLVAEYLASAGPAQGLRWGLGGRDRGKLEAVRADLAARMPALADLPLYTADAHDRPSLERLAGEARVVCTTVGPYARYGSDLVAACVERGTHYCDLTGEVHWIRRMIDEHHDAARERGVRIVHCCGFDSIPSDLGVLLLHEEMRRRGRQLARVDAFFGESKGRFSGGTVASMIQTLDDASRDKDSRRALGDPYGLDPRPRQGGPDGPDQKGIRYEPRLGRWTAPFVMAAINTRVVRRSNAVTDYRYGREFRYTEQMSLPGGAKGLAAAAGITGALGAFVGAMQVAPLRKLLEPRLPKPGEGPTPEEREAGYWTLRQIGEAAPTDAGPLRLLARIGDRRDPGYGSTSVMLGESALCLAKDDLTSEGGVLTPASAMGLTLVERLRAAGQDWTVSEM